MDSTTIITMVIGITNSVQLVPKGPINNNPALVQIMAWRRPGDKPLSETMLASLLTHICVTRPQWVKPFSKKDPCCHMGIRFCVSDTNVIMFLSYGWHCFILVGEYIALRMIHGFVCKKLWFSFLFHHQHDLMALWPLHIPVANQEPNWCLVNILRLRQNGCHFADDTFKRILLNENVRISIKISLKFVPKGLINNIPALV